MYSVVSFYVNVYSHQVVHYILALKAQYNLDKMSLEQAYLKVVNNINLVKVHLEKPTYEKVYNLQWNCEYNFSFCQKDYLVVFLTDS